jgi:hypothetical protein
MGLFDHLYHLDWSALYTLEYYYNDGRHVVFNKYEIDMFGNIYNKKSGKKLAPGKSAQYDRVSVVDSTGKARSIFVSRAIVSTFQGKPPTLKHSAEHIDCTNKDNDIVSELTWMDPSGQSKNRNKPDDDLCAYIIIRDELEMSAKDWSHHLSSEKNAYGREYTEGMIYDYAQRKKHGFSYKVYDDLPGEKWYKVVNSDNKKGHWEISDHNRVARVSKYARNVIDATRFGFDGTYPKILINGITRRLHDVAFETFYPEEYAVKKPGEMILHKFDDKLDFRPHALYIGSASTNQKDSHNNGSRKGTKTARTACCSYINDVLERRHESQDDAAKYLRMNGKPNAHPTPIGKALKSDKVLKIYGRTWKFL